MLAGGIVAYGDALAGRVPTTRDFVGFTIPSGAVWRSAVADGGASAWNPLVGLGLTRAINALLYPGHVLFAVGGVVTGVVVTWLAHVAWAAAGGYLLARELRARPAAAVVSGAVWAFGGYAVSMWWNGERVLADAWVPWVALTAAWSVRWPRAMAGLAACTAMCVAVDPFVLFEAAALAVATLAAAPGDDTGRRPLRGLGRPLAGLALGLALAAPVLLPAMAVRSETVRAAALTQAAAEAWSMHPARIPELFVPAWFGSPFDVEHYPGGAYAQYPTVQALPWAVSLYAGAAVLVFAPLVRSRRQWVALGGTALLFLALALGEYTPLHDLARRLVPGLSLERYPEKHVLVTVGALGLLGSCGLERALAQRIAWWKAAAAPLALLAGAFLLAPAPLRDAGRHGVLECALAAAALVALLAIARHRPAVAWAIAAVAAIDLGVAARPFQKWSPRPVYVDDFAAAVPARPDAAPRRLYRPRTADYERGTTLPDNAAQVFGIATVPGHDPAHSAHLEALVSALEPHGERLARILGLDAIMLPDEVPFPATPRVHEDGWSLYAVGPAPRAWVVGRVRRAPLDVAIDAVASGGFDPSREAIVSSTAEPSLDALARSSPESAGECRMLTYHRTSLSLECDTTRPGLAVMSEMDADGWHATVDGTDAPIFPTDVALRGVALPAGHHRIDMRYETPGQAEGWLVTALSALVLVLMLASSRAAPPR